LELIHDHPRGDNAERSDEEGQRMIIRVNTEPLEVDDQTTVAALLQSLGYPDRGIAVAVDQALLPRSAWATTLSDGAQLEVVTAVQGG
jgi:sulfur carrier protein